jgi:hypothetical protein
MKTKYYIAPKIKRMIRKPATIINVLCNQFKVEPSKVFDCLNNLESDCDALVLINKGSDSMTYAKINFGSKYGADTYTIETMDADNPIFKVFYYCFFMTHERPAFIDMKESMIEDLKKML